MKLADEFFIPEVDKRLAAANSKAKFEWTRAWGGTAVKLGSESGAIKDGIAELAFVSTIFEAPKFPLQNVSYVAPFMTDDVAMICYTSGTTGNPKGVMLSHANMLATARAFAEVEDIRASDDWLAYLPMAWVGDALYSTVLGLLVGFACNCPESPETVQRDLRELGPSTVLAPPRIWENMLTGLLLKANDASPLKRHTRISVWGLCTYRSVISSAPSSSQR